MTLTFKIETHNIALSDVGTTLHRQAKVQHPAMALCPCCLVDQEDQAHFVHCTANGARTAAMSELLTTMKGTEHHPFGITIAVSLDRYLTSPDAPVDIPYTKLEARYHEPIREALDDQQRIGWLHFLRGFTPLSWLHLASINVLDSKKSDRKRGDHRIHTLLQALHTFTRSLWLGRNEALHSTKETTDAVKFNADSAEIQHPPTCYLLKTDTTVLTT